jgi:cytochrome c-type biogenesis protein CcmH/NrfF
MSLIVASHFLAGALLTWAMPIGLIVAVGLYWTLLLRRRSTGSGTGKVE